MATNANKIPVPRLVREHLALKQAGVNSFVVRHRMILHAHLRATDFKAWVKARGALTVFEVIEIDGEQMEERLAGKAGTFRRDEITLTMVGQKKQGALV